MIDIFNKIKRLPLSSAMVALSTGADVIGSTTLVQPMADAALALLASLMLEQREKIKFPFDDIEPSGGHCLSRNHSGMPLKAMNGVARRLVYRFLAAGLGAQGYWKATSIMALKSERREIDTWNGPGRMADTGEIPLLPYSRALIAHRMRQPAKTKPTTFTPCGGISAVIFFVATATQHMLPIDRHRQNHAVRVSRPIMRFAAHG